MTQKEKLLNLLSDYKPHRTDEIMEVVYGSSHLGLCRIGARIHDLKADGAKFEDGWKDKITPSLFWYQLKPQENTLFGSVEKSTVSEKDLLKYR